tara:strand:- start:22 stop:1011 length:990 start_codon:yes stop_codon:yes gene_type:complete
MAKTPSDINKERARDARKRAALSGTSSSSTIDPNSIDKSTPNNLKPQGIQRLSSLFLEQGKKLAKKATPALTALIAKFGIEQLKGEMDGGANPEELKQKYCPTKEELDNLIRQRNDIVDFLNNTGNILDRLATTVNFGAGIASLFQGIINGLARGKTLAQIAMSFIPFALPGAVPAAIDTLGDIKDQTTFKEDGTPRLPPLTSVASTVAPSISATQFAILKITTLLNSLDILIQLCSPTADLTKPSPTITTLAENELLAERSPNGGTYKGFILEIETKAYTDTVNQSRAVAKNKSNIILLTTEYSFASDPNVLIEEIKFIIDRDDLKAY